ncbi:MAG: EamA family transporter, partial [Phycisphaerales bacterium]|nr:EamA family transporter [Phycisphaerales bacterium]
RPAADLFQAAGTLPVMKAILLATMAGLCWGVGELFTKAVLHSGKVGPITAIAVRSTIALPILWLVYAILVHGRGGEPRDWASAGAPVLSKLALGSGLIAGAGGMLCFYLALSVGEVSRIKPIAFTVAPAVAVLLGWLVLGESMNVQKLIGVTLVCAGVVVLSIR